MRVNRDNAGRFRDVEFPIQSYSEGAGPDWKVLGWYDGPLAFRMDGRWRLVQYDCDHDKVYEYWILYEYPDMDLNPWKDVQTYLLQNNSPVHLMRIDMHRHYPVWEYVKTCSKVTDVRDHDFESDNPNYEPTL